ncbi:MAG: arabinofuranosidase catalytic domain-containing protein [Steroidobacteraceae bacterium]
MILKHSLVLAAVLTLPGVATAQAAGTGLGAVPARPKGPCDIYAAGGDPCVAAYSTTRALYASYDGPLYRIRRQSDGRSENIGVVQPAGAPVPDGGGYADGAAQSAFCAGTYCWITRLYDQSPKHNDLTQAPRGGWSGPALGGMDNVPLADMAPVMVMGHQVYGVFIEPGMGLRDDDPRGTAVDDQAEGQYWVVNGRHFNSGCCNDFGNAEIDSRDDDAGTMETAYFGDAPWWYHGTPPGPWVMTDQENNLVGCVNPDGSKLCPKLPNIQWRFVTGVAKGEPHHWTSMGGNAQHGALSVMFSGPRVDWQYDPMRKQGGVVLGNGGDNSNGSQGTFYEGAMTAAGTFPSNDTDQRVQNNIVAARYRRSPVSIAPATDTAAPPNLQTFSPGSSQDTTVTFTNTTSAPARDLTLSVSAPNLQWASVVKGSSRRFATFAGPVAAGASVSATFRVTPGSEPFDGDLAADARWTDANDGRERFARRIEKVRNFPPVRINEFRIGTSSPGNGTNSFIELYNAGAQAIDISHWTLTEHPSQQAIFSTVTIPAGTRLAAGGFYLFGLANSGLAADAPSGATSLYVRSTDGIKAGDTIRIGTGSHMEERRITRVGTPAAIPTTLWQPLPDGLITIPRGSTNVPVQDASRFVVGQKIALGYGSTFPVVPAARERYEFATVTAVGKPGTQAYLAAPAPAGSTNIKVTDAKDISAGDRIRLDIDSVGHGIETVTVTKVGSAASVTRLAHAASAAATHIQVQDASGFAVGDRMIVDIPARRQTVTIISVHRSRATAARVDFEPALRQSYPKGAAAIDPGAGLDLAAPLRYTHSANLPFSDRGTGISFGPATRFAHISNDPVQPLGIGISIDRPLAENHEVHAAVRDAAVTTAGYQGTPAPNQWFGGPELTAQSPLFGHFITVRAGSMVLRNAAGLVVDSLNYGGIVDPWAGEGDQSVSGFGKDGCYIAAPGAAASAGASAGRFPDGANSDSNCGDFVTSPVTAMAAAAAAGAKNIKVAAVTGFEPGQTIRIDAGTHAETALIEKVGTAGATKMRAPISGSATVIPVGDAREFHVGQTISIGGDTRRETAVVSGLNIFDSPTVVVASPLILAHGAGTEVSGSGITLAQSLRWRHPQGTPVAGSAATPGARNRYDRGAH